MTCDWKLCQYNKDSKCTHLNPHLRCVHLEDMEWITDTQLDLLYTLDLESILICDHYKANFTR